MFTINPQNISLGRLQSYLTCLVAPRPIAFASTIDKNGKNNLSPFSFFNIFSNNPPVVIFSPARRVRDNTTKHSFENLLEVPEVVINMVSYEMTNQASLASTEYPKGTDEFIKSGFTAIDSEIVKPKRVKESPVQMECKINNIIELSKNGGAGILVVAEIILIHVSESVMQGDRIDQNLLRLVGRLGENYYCKAFGDALYEVEKPLTTMGIGVDALPLSIRKSKYIVGNQLGALGNIEQIPDYETAERFVKEEKIEEIISQSPLESEKIVHMLIAKYTEMGENLKAWNIIRYFEMKS